MSSVREVRNPCPSINTKKKQSRHQESILEGNILFFLSDKLIFRTGKNVLPHVATEFLKFLDRHKIIEPKRAFYCYTYTHKKKGH